MCVSPHLSARCLKGKPPFNFLITSRAIATLYSRVGDRRENIFFEKLLLRPFEGKPRVYSTRARPSARIGTYSFIVFSRRLAEGNVLKCVYVNVFVFCFPRIVSSTRLRRHRQ